MSGLDRSVRTLAALTATLVLLLILYAPVAAEAWGIRATAAPADRDGGRRDKDKEKGQEREKEKGKEEEDTAQLGYSAFYPVHPRVNINWTDNSLRANATRKELHGIEREKLVVTKLIVVNRHGHRAPNEAYWQMCPNDRKSLRRYDVGYEDLSGLGMKEEYNFGQYIRQRYHNFLGNRFNRTLHYFRAVGEPRTLQSAMAVAQGIFPDGFGPGGFLPSRPQFVPIFSEMDTHEYLLDDVPCFNRAQSDSDRWLNGAFKAFLAEPEVNDTLRQMEEICGPYTGTLPYFAYIKTVSDGMIFNSEMGKNAVGGRLTPELLYRVRRVSIRLLLSRLYSTDEQQTYTVVDLPETILTQLNHTHLGEGEQLNNYEDTRQESTFFFVHRETLYAMAQFFGFQFRVAGLPSGEVPVASSLIIEKLMPEKDQFTHDNTRVYVRMSLWTPYDGTHTLALSGCRIPELCQMQELLDIYHTRVKRTGTWRQLCNYRPVELNHTTDVR